VTEHPDVSPAPDATVAPGAPATDAPPKKRRGLRVLWWILGIIGGLIVAAVVGILIWSQVGVMAAEPEPLAAVRADDRIVITDEAAAIVMEPVGGSSGTGLVFIPGAKVDPWAYAANLSGVVAEAGVTVVITKPILNLAFFDLRPLDTFTSLAPDVSAWAVGGHSLGGVRGCLLAEDADALALFASYCANDLSGSGLPALSISGSEDLLTTPQDIEDGQPLLPGGAEFVEIDGANHASFGNYGPQAGDGEASITDEDMQAVLTELLTAFLGVSPE
jgi:hypothetical protein